MTYYRGLRLLTRKERRPRGRGRLGSEDRSLEAEKVIEQSGLQNELHKTQPGSSRPLLPIAQFFIVGFTIFVLAGGLFVLAQGGQGLLNVSRGLQWVYPGDVNNQTTLES